MKWSDKLATLNPRTRLARLGDVYPIGASTGMVTVAGKTWDLWIGMNGNMKVYSFVAPSTMNSFSADAKQFFNYLQTNQGFPVSSQYLIGESTVPSRRRPVKTLPLAKL